MNNILGPGALMLDVQGLQLSAEDRELLSHPRVGGVILGLYGRNFASIGQLQDLVAAIRACQPHLLIAVDQEGGRVQRFRQEFTRLPPMHRFGELYRREPKVALSLANTCGWLMAAEVLACGLDFSFAPVLDLYLQESRIIADRAFAAEPDTVVALATEFIDGMHAAGMKATGKHFPGHGSVVEDSHVELPVDARDLEQLLATDLVPFARCVDHLDAVMPGHVLYPQVDSQCAAMSRVWLQDILRRQLGFDGVVFSDDLTMQAAGSAGDVLQRARLAMAAGCDMILVCNDRPQARVVLDWLDADDLPGSDRLPAMRGKPELDWDTLHAGDRWQLAREQISALVGCCD
ncbi:MAG: beta-N-acetylhexosaminidase [Gammaproteobacteria bacterium]|nr:beta-N-acetylhexosaminidase [Pseudomonadales bacterium]MCP5346084.1 beta-N-acetylhexosaminidase [Pseudomonadales bacterium]